MGEPLVALEPNTGIDEKVRGSAGFDERTLPGAAIADFQGMQLLIAETEADRERAYRLRYQVYCVDNDFEPAVHHPDGRETDSYDDQSVHCLLACRDTDTVAGTARLILPCRKEGNRPLPTPQICASGVLAAHSHRIPANSAAELSRFAVPKSWRSRRDAPFMGNKKGAFCPALSSRAASSVSLGLMRGVVAMAYANGITHLYALMDPALLRMLRGLSIHFEKLGPVVDYHGRRQPCFCDLDQLLQTTLTDRPDIWSILTAHGALWPIAPASPNRLHPRTAGQ